MEVCTEWEIYIPVEAEVKNIPLKSLPKSVLRRMGLSVSDSDSSRKPTDSSDVTWICPVVIGRKGQGSASCQENHENALAFISTELAGALKMSFVSSSRAARDALKNISAGKPSSKEQLSCQDSALVTNQNAVVIYNGQIYLCIRKARTRKQKKRELLPLCQAAIPKARSNTKELIGSGQRKKTNVGKVKRCQKAELKRKGGPSVRAEYSAPSRSEEADRTTHHGKAYRKELVSDRPIRQPQEEQKNPSRMVHGEHDKDLLDQEESSVWTNDMVLNQMDSQDDEHSGGHGWTVTESLGTATASTSRQMDFDFNELEQEEKIAQLKARFMQNEAALKNLLS